jgi:hypothetical protein
MWLRSWRLDDQIWRGCESRLWLFEIAANIFQNEETLAGNLQTQTIDSVWMVSVGPNHHQKRHPRIIDRMEMQEITIQIWSVYQR